MNSREVVWTGRAGIRTAAALLLGISFVVTGLSAESPDKMVVTRQADPVQAHSIYERDARKLPLADGLRDRFNSWLAAQSVQQSIVQDNDIVQAGLSNVTSGPGLQLASTSYDCQQNDAVTHQIATMGGNQYVHFAWTHWDVLPNSVSTVDRYVNFRSYNSTTGSFLYGTDGVWISGATCDPLMARGGFVTLDVDEVNRAQIAFHQRDCPQQPSADYCSYFMSQSAPNAAIFTEGALNGSKGVLGNYADDILWPHISVDRQAGTDYYHIVSHTYSSNNNIVYWRHNGTLWQGPYVVDSTPYLSYNVATDPTSARCALVSNSPPVTADPTALSQIMYRESATNGDDWGPVDVTGLGDSRRVFITNYADPAGPVAWSEVVGDYDNSGNLHVIWVEQRYNGVGDQAALKHWDKTSGSISTIQQAYWDNKGQNSYRKLNVALPSLGFGDGSTTCGSGTNLDYLYLTYVQFGGTSALEQSDKSALGYMNGEIYLSSSPDGGRHWSVARNLTNTHKPGCDPTIVADSCPSENWPSLARTVDDTLHIMYIDDKDAGDAVFSQGNWTMNPVMYYRIPGGTNTQPVCPSLEPNAGITLTDSNGPDCEYNTPPNTSIHESLVISNSGLATLTGTISKSYINPPSGTWLQMPTVSYAIPVGGANLSYPVTMNAAGLAEGVYQAQIAVTHNDPKKASPMVFPVDFFVFVNFACPENVVLHTKWLELEVSNVERVADGPDRSGSQLRGLYRAPRFGQTDSGNNSIYDASLIIARPPSPDTVVYRYLFGLGKYAKGFRALSGLTVDTSRYGTNTGIVYARARQTTVDSVIGVDVEYQFPQNTDSSNFVLINYKVYNRTTSAIPGLIVGEAADFDIVPSTSNRIYQAGHENLAGFNSSLNLIYQQGADSGGTVLAKKYLGGMTAIQCSPAPRAWSAPNGTMLFPRTGGGFTEGYLYQELVKSGFEIVPNPGTTSGSDRHSVIAFEKNVNLTPTTVKHYTLGFVTSTLGPSDADLVATTKKAWRAAFGWQEFTDYDTIWFGGTLPKSYPYSALGSHESGPFSSCCGCVVSKISDRCGKFSIVPDADNCTGTINFAGPDELGGVYRATFRVSTPSCAGPVYTEDRTITVIAIGPDCYCPYQGDPNADGSIDVFDVIEAIKIAFAGGNDLLDPACPRSRTDVNADGIVDVFDVILEIEIAFQGGYPANPCPQPRSCLPTN